MANANSTPAPAVPCGVPTTPAADHLHHVATLAVDALRAISRHIEAGSPDYGLCLNLEFIADGLDRAVDEYDRAALAGRAAA